MKTVYHADTGFQAHLIKGLLEANGIPAQVAGDYLPGGLGELPTMGLVTVSVNDPDGDHAARIITQYEQGSLHDENTLTS